MGAIAIDLWDKRCGIATESLWIAFAQDIVARHKVISVVKKYISENKYDTIVIWLPHDLYGKIDRQLNKTKDFIAKLSGIFPDLEVVWIDERFTSFAADQTLREMGSSDNIGSKDALAAAEILQTYLDTKKS